MFLKKFLIIFLFLFFPLFTFATNSSDIVINEIAWMGTNQVEGVESKNLWRYEWLELYNTTSNTISLDDWKIELYRTGLDFSINLKGNILANGYFLVASFDKIANYDFNYSNLAGKFNNNGQKVVLKNNSGEIIDSIDCYSTGKWFAGDNTTKQTMEKTDTGPTRIGYAEGVAGGWQTSANSGGTPRAQNGLAGVITAEPINTTETPQNPPEALQNTPQPVVEQIYPIGVIFNEILPSPEGADDQNEWIVSTIQPKTLAYL